MAFAAQKLLVAFDAGSVSGALVPWRLGPPRVLSLARVPLTAGALVPSPFDDNLARPADIQAALKELARQLKGGRRACLILPDGVARTALVEVPARADPRDFARFRLAPSLPYPGPEAIVDVLPLGGGRCVAAAVRRSVVQAYEAAADAAGYVLERVDLAPLAALAALLRSRQRQSGVDVILGDVALSLAGFDSARNLRVFRSRRRDPGPDEAARLREEVDRTASLAGIGEPRQVRVVGAGAPVVIRALCFGGRAAQPGWDAPDDRLLPFGASELAWLGAALA